MYISIRAARGIQAVAGHNKRQQARGWLRRLQQRQGLLIRDTILILAAWLVLVLISYWY
jgi:hypothetical protein